MRPTTSIADSTSQTFLTGAILFANFDYSSYAGYALKTALAGAIWMIFKLAGDYLSDSMLQKKKKKREEENQEGNDFPNQD